MQESTTPELCARWISAGSFYTFARSHSNRDAIPQELYRWPEVARAARNALSLRYQLLPYLYTAFARAHACGGTVMRPIWWTTGHSSGRDSWCGGGTGDRGTDLGSMGHAASWRLRVTEISGEVDQWLWGDSVMVTPILYEGKRDRNVEVCSNLHPVSICRCRQTYVRQMLFCIRTIIQVSAIPELCACAIVSEVSLCLSVDIASGMAVAMITVTPGKRLFPTSRARISMFAAV